MIGSIITRVFVLIFGYIYPAYECFKSVEMNKPDIDQLRFWCQYWILVAGFTVCERVGDTFIGWVPMYSEAKLAFFIYLWFPKTKGTTYVYDSFFRPYVAKHEPEIDRNLIELRTRVGDMAILFWQKGGSYVQTRIFDILQYIASQSNPPKPPHKQQGTRVVQKPNLRSKDDSSEEEVGPSKDSRAAPPIVPPPILNERKTKPSGSIVEPLNGNEEEAMEIDMAMDPPAAAHGERSAGIMKRSSWFGWPMAAPK